MVIPNIIKSTIMESWWAYAMGDAKLSDIVDGMKEAKTVEEFVGMVFQVSVFFDLKPVIKTVGDKIICSLPETIEFDNYWLKPTQHNQCFIYTKNVHVKQENTG